jgi:hypothetical protein
MSFKDFSAAQKTPAKSADADKSKAAAPATPAPKPAAKS